jgi:hypothetical protein
MIADCCHRLATMNVSSIKTDGMDLAKELRIDTDHATKLKLFK